MCTGSPDCPFICAVRFYLCTFLIVRVIFSLPLSNLQMCLSPQFAHLNGIVHATHDICFCPRRSGIGRQYTSFLSPLFASSSAHSFSSSSFYFRWFMANKTHFFLLLKIVCVCICMCNALVAYDKAAIVIVHVHAVQMPMHKHLNDERSFIQYRRSRASDSMRWIVV